MEEKDIDLTEQAIPAQNEVENTPETAPEETVAPLSELDQLKADLADQKDKYLRLMAEFENFRRRTAKERLELIQTAGTPLVFLPIHALNFH